MCVVYIFQISDFNQPKISLTNIPSRNFGLLTFSCGQMNRFCTHWGSWRFCTFCAHLFCLFWLKLRSRYLFFVQSSRSILTLEGQGNWTGGPHVRRANNGPIEMPSPEYCNMPLNIITPGYFTWHWGRDILHSSIQSLFLYMLHVIFLYAVCQLRITSEQTFFCQWVLFTALSRWKVTVEREPALSGSLA